MMSSAANNEEESRRRARKGIPASIVIPSSSSQRDDDDESLSSLEGYRYLDQPDRIIRTPSIKLRTQSLPTCLSTSRAQRALVDDVNRTTGTPEGHHEDCGSSNSSSMMMSNTGTDRPPKVPLRRRSLHSSNSLPMSKIIAIPLPMHGASTRRGPRTSVRRALAA